MKRIVLLWVAALAVEASSAQYTLTVRVRDLVTGAAIPGATVDLVLRGAVTSTVSTGSDGMVSFAVATSAEEMPGSPVGAGSFYPNPSGGSSTVQISLETPGTVRIAMVDVLGRVVAMVSREVPRGNHSIRVGTAGVPSGTYFVNIVSSVGRIVRPITVLEAQTGTPFIDVNEGGTSSAAAGKSVVSSEQFVLRVSAAGYSTKTAFVVVDGDVEATVVMARSSLPEEVNSIGMEFVRIPGGTFTMGSSNGYVEERPPHTVTITRDFWMGKYEVTQAEYFPITGRRTSESDREPVEGEPWTRAVEFANALSRRENLSECYDSNWDPVGYLPACTGYRLPTEAEWEYGARAQTTTDYSFGSDAGQIGQYAWFFGNSDTADGRVLHEVAGLLPNPWGLHDMHGNVWEWVHDRYGTYDASAPLTDPLGPSAGSHRVIRGGGWVDHAFGLRSARRYHLYGRLRGFDTGFRLVRTAW